MSESQDGLGQFKSASIGMWVFARVRACMWVFVCVCVLSAVIFVLIEMHSKCICNNRGASVYIITGCDNSVCVKFRS